MSALFEAAGRLSALVALLVLGLVQGLVSPAHALLICGLMVLVAFLGTALRSASARERGQRRREASGRSWDHASFCQRRGIQASQGLCLSLESCLPAWQDPNRLHSYPLPLAAHSGSRPHRNTSRFAWRNRSLFSNTASTAKRLIDTIEAL